MAELKDKLVSLEGLDYFNRNVAQPHEESLSTLAEALYLVKQWVDGAEQRIDTLENTSNGSFASMFEIALPDVIHVSSDADAVAVIENALNLDGFSGSIGTSGIRWKRPTIILPNIAWSSDVDSNYDRTATANIRIVFGEAGAVTKTVTLKKPGEGKIYGARLSNKDARIDTGIAADYSYTLHAKGYSTISTGSLIGAYVSNNERTTLRILPGGGSIQHMWANNTQIQKTILGIDNNSEFEYWHKAGYLRVVQGQAEYTQSMTGNTYSGKLNANLCILNEQGQTFGYGTFIFAEVLDSNGEQVAYFAPYKLLDGEVVVLNTSGISAQQIYDIVENGDSAEMASRILRPNTGYLEEVSAA